VLPRTSPYTQTSKVAAARSGAVGFRVGQDEVVDPVDDVLGVGLGLLGLINRLAECSADEVQSLAEPTTTTPSPRPCNGIPTPHC
jgi:hypothetical protein